MLSFLVSQFSTKRVLFDVSSYPTYSYRVGGEWMMTFVDCPTGFVQITFADSDECYQGHGSGFLHFAKRSQCLLATLASNPKELYFSVTDNCCASFKTMFTTVHYEGVMSKDIINEVNLQLKSTPRNPLYTVHGVTSVAHLWFNTRDVASKTILKPTWTFTHYGATGNLSMQEGQIWQSSLKTQGDDAIGKIDYTTYELGTSKLPSGSRVHRTDSGIIIDVTDKFCVFKAIAQFCDGDAEEWLEFASLARVLCDKQGAFPKNKIASLVQSLKIQHVDLDLKLITNDIKLADKGCWYVASDNQHAYAILPRKMRQQRLYIPLVMVNKRFSDYLKGVSTVFENNDQPSQSGTKTKNNKISKPTRVSTQNMEKRVDHDKVYIGKLIEQVAQIDLNQLSDFNFEEIQAWDSVNLKFKYRRQLRWVPVYPNLNITTLETLKTAISLFKNYFPKLFKRQDNVSNLIFNPDISPLIAGREICWVSKQAEQSLGAETLISLHQHQIVHIPKKQEKDVKKLTAGFLNIKAVPAGVIPTEFLKCLVTYGLQIDQDMQKYMSSKSGGHASCRFPNDVLAAENLTRIVNTKTDQLTMDLGAKFGCNGPLLKAATHYSGVDLRTEVDSDLYRMKYIIHNVQSIFARDFARRSAEVFDHEAFHTENAWKIMEDVPESLRKSMLLYFRCSQSIRDGVYTLNEMASFQKLRDQILECKMDIINSKENAEQSGKRLDQMTNLLKTQTDQKQKCSIVRTQYELSDVISTFIREVRARPRQWYQPIRPDDTQYNKVYYQENGLKYQAHTESGIVCPGQINLLPVFKGYVQAYDPKSSSAHYMTCDDQMWLEFEQVVINWLNIDVDLQTELQSLREAHSGRIQQNIAKTIQLQPQRIRARLIWQLVLKAQSPEALQYFESRSFSVCINYVQFINDVHYYLGGYVPSYPCTMYVSGIDFHCFPGHYRLPCNEGSYTIWAGDDYRANISMNTQGNSQIYSHPFIKVHDQTKRLDFGWTAFFSRIYVHQIGAESIFEIVSVPIVEELKYPQANYIVQYHAIQQIETQMYKSLSALQRQSLQQMYSEAQVEQLLTTGFQQNRQRGSILQRMTKIFYEQNTQATQQQLDSFVRNTNYSIYKNIGMTKEETYLSFFKFRNEQTFSQNKINDDEWSLSLRQFKRTQVRTLAHQDVCSIMVAGRDDDTQNKCLQAFLKPWNQVSTKQAVEAFSSTRPEKPKQPKQSQDSAPAETRTYYAIKPIPGVISHNTLTMDTKDFQQTKDNLGKWLSERKPDVVNRLSSVVNSGYDIIKQGEKLNSFEWCAKSEQNSYVALVGRQLNSITQICPKKLTRFEKVSMDYLIGLTSKMSTDPLFIHDLRNFNPLAWLNTRTTFDEAKRSKYHKTIHQQMTQIDPRFISSFKTMVKSGEVYVTEQEVPLNSDFLDQDSRPRNISVPSQATCGFLTAIQSVIFPSIQRFEPGFIQGCTKQELTSRIIHGLKEVKPTKSVSIDGSSFDSCQYQPLQNAVDNVFWKLLEPIFEQHLCKDAQFQPQSPKFVSNLIRDACQNVHTLFCKLPVDSEYNWTGQQKRTYRRDWPNCKDLKGDQFLKKYIPITIRGTTFSGHPTATTLGNTLRSICYVLFYASEAGIKVKSYKYYVAGDDVVIYITDECLNQFVYSMSECTSRSNDPKPVGLGQIIKEINIRNWDDIEFCSKWSFSDGSYDSFSVTRDVEKALLTRQYYNGDNRVFKSDPDAYVSALLEGFQSEHVSELMEDIFVSRLKGPHRAGYSCLLKRKFEQCGNYEWQDRINSRLGITIATLYRVLGRNQVMIAGRENPNENLLARLVNKNRPQQHRASSWNRSFSRGVQSHCTPRAASFTRGSEDVESSA